mmetsp:Transcript_19518/g.62712  ORF Transcript_19518/g.62712 Transcript_19518/m.62712 type:complete len:142 (+) Transcript_19518:264-689(+)
MGWKHNSEHETVEGFSLDLADPESKRAMEVDGPSHYLQDASTGDYVENGATRLKSRLLRSFGWKVAHVAFFEWDDASESDRRQLLVKKLACIGVDDAQGGDREPAAPESSGAVLPPTPEEEKPPLPDSTPLPSSETVATTL